MAGKTDLYERVLSYLEKASVSKSAREISESIGSPYSSVARVLSKLTSQYQLQRQYSDGNSYKYKFKSWTPKGPASKAARLAIPTSTASDSLPVDPRDFQGVVTGWMKNGWRPRSVDAAKTLVETLSSIFQLQWLEITRGQPVSQEDLDHLKLKLLEAKRMADTFADFFGRLVATEQLWDSKKTTAYTLSDVEDPQSFLEYVRKVNEVLQ